MFLIFIIINYYNKKVKEEETKYQSNIKHIKLNMLEEIKNKEVKIKQMETKIKQLEEEAEEAEEEEEYDIDQNVCDEILLLTMIECMNYNHEQISKIINKNINKYKHTDKLDKHTKYNINDIFNDASIDKQVNFIKLVFTLDNVKNKKYLIDKIFIADEDTFDDLVEYAIKTNMHDLFEFVFKSKSFKINEDKYLEYEKIINNKDMYLLFIKHKIEEEYHNSGIN
jgi:hypothetical protein